MGSKSSLTLMMVGTLVCASVFAALAALPPSSSAIAQQQEATSLGEEEEGESLADNIMSNVLDGGNDDGEDNNNGAAGDSAEFVDQDNFAEQNAGNIGLQGQDQEQDQGAANLALNEALDVTVQRTAEPPTPPPPDDGGPPPECSLEITADKEIYEPGDVVAVTITNTGDEPLEFPNSALGLQIRNVETGEVFPLVAAQVITTLEPGESRTFEFTYEDLVSEIGSGLISATVTSECAGVEEVTFRLSEAPPPDTTAPIITVPADMVVEAASEQGTVVTYTVTAQDDRDGTVPVECTPASGSTFPVGVTTVECTATDADGNIATASFTITVQESPLENGKIVFTSNRDGGHQYEIYIMNKDGTEQTRLTNNPAIEEDPNLSPDGTKILFISFRDGNGEIYVMNADGTEQTRLTNSGANEQGVDWSPDGTKIVFVRTEEIYVMNADGSNTIKLTNNIVVDSLPDWSPDGTKIAFVRGEEIYVMNADGTEQTRLTYIPGYDGVPDWSPDGEKIAFGHGYNTENREIYVMNAVDGSELVNISNHPHDDFWPSWSPDGTKIAFMSNRDGGIEIFVMNPDGSEPTNISKYLPAHDEQPDWGPAADTTD
jgi:Tol biopolymer transport system component